MRQRLKVSQLRRQNLDITLGEGHTCKLLHQSSRAEIANVTVGTVERLRRINLRRDLLDQSSRLVPKINPQLQD